MSEAQSAPCWMVNTVIVRDNPCSTAPNLHEIAAMYHQRDGVRITWLLDFRTLEKREDLKQAVLEVRERHGDEVTLFNYNDPIRFDQA